MFGRGLDGVEDMEIFLAHGFLNCNQLHMAGINASQPHSATWIRSGAKRRPEFAKGDKVVFAQLLREILWRQCQRLPQRGLNLWARGDKRVLILAQRNRGNLPLHRVSLIALQK